MQNDKANPLGFRQADPEKFKFDDPHQLAKVLLAEQAVLYAAQCQPVSGVHPLEGSNPHPPQGAEMNQIMKALKLAVGAHAGQEDQGGGPYIDHPVRVADGCKVHGDEFAIVALLHDVVEDTDVTWSQIEEQFGPAVASAVDALTRRLGESYTDFLARCRDNAIAVVVKAADIRDNLDPERLSKLPLHKQAHFREKYAGALEFLAATTEEPKP